MAALTFRSAVGRPLTNSEVDANFSALNLELGQKLVASLNLLDLPNPAQARSNLGLGNVENKSSATIRGELTSGNVTGALGYTPLSTAGGTLTDDLTLSGTGLVIAADFSNATASLRAAFQTSTSNGNTVVPAKPHGSGTAAYFIAHNAADADNSAYVYMGATATDALLRADKAGTGSYLPISVFAGAARQAKVLATANAVNYLTLSGGETGGYAILGTDGSDASVGMVLQTKNGGSYALQDNNGSRGLLVTPVANGVNYVQAVNAITGAAPYLVAAGSDTNIPLVMASKGTGNVLFNANNANVLALWNPASAVNAVIINGNTAGSAPGIGATGTDNNIDINISPKGSGKVSIAGTKSTINGYTPGPSNMMGRNKIINGKMEIAQRGTTYLPLPVNSYFLDRWVYNATTTAVINAAQHLDAPTAEYRSSLRTEVTTADISIATGDNAVISQRIEGFNARDLISRTFTLSFWVRSSKTGTHCVFFKNGGNDRSYVAEYTISAANTWEQKSITVSGGLITAGAWDWASGVGLQVGFVLACGSTYHNTANAWNTGNFLATANQVNCLDTVGNIFAITGVQLEVGSVATPFEHRPYGAELALCQRYYEKTRIWARFQSASGGTYINSFSHRQAMRVVPTLTKESETVIGAGTTNTLSGSNSLNFYITTTTTSTTQAGFTDLIYAANAEL